jgi:methylenetetrahydrofolate reductase (NADPH)
VKTFRAAAQSQGFTISAELTLRRGSTAKDVAAQAKLLRGQVDGMQVTDNPLAWAQMSALAASALLLNNGMDPVPIISCRDRNRVALQSDLLGLRALGVTSLLLTRGRRVPKKHALHPSTVFDISGRDLISMASALDQESEQPQVPFFIGTGVKVHRAKPGWRAESLQAKAEAGAQFLQTQLCYNLDLLRHYMERLVQVKATWNYSVFVSLAPLPSLDAARWIKQQMPDSKIPEALLRRLEQASDPEQEGIRICAEAMQEIAAIPGVSGVHLMTTGSPEHLAAAIDGSGLRPAGG